ncbi:ABC transporter ATP-binding protein [Shewanella benthica]|uniref:Iron-compound ABC transporter, ATP-binding protein, putative n=1 Tax=Shewanella benthica KT99 TaxID=314608 RepID=A9D398_9GAMM|nr:ABC transporter ATP-binding protein [Shewanella benthica]EDQ01640.1 iron-compound ABC transporter, ATP-binding protein, putative [Shewanella benthica KT99]
MPITMVLPDSHMKVSNLSWATPEKRVLDDISFSVERGGFLGILGPNGVGKSSLLRCMYKYMRPSSGEVYLNGKNIRTFSQQEFSTKVAVVLQHTPLGFSMTGRQLLATGLINRQKWWQTIDHAQEKIEVDRVLDLVGLSAQGHQLFESMSGGEQQRLLIARALLQKPEILLLDEPTNHLDVGYQVEILQLIKSLGITVVASIHDLNLASAFCDKLLLLRQGKLVKYGTPAQVLTPESIENIYGIKTDVDRHPTGIHPRVTFHFDGVRHAAV